ncbi:MAG: hypothetical protein PWR27_904 [Petroclostridium sp.]|jgi:hypothetical protein|nr:hypothetical protein [Clostridia bacterium]MDK2810195.1 hypothetical protein [Petroclostridium sp.]
MSFLGNLFDNDEILWFIILFLLLFWGFGGYGYGYARKASTDA